MVIDTNSRPTGAPNFGCGDITGLWEQHGCRTCCSTVLQLNYEPTLAVWWPWGQVPLQLDSPALLYSVLPAFHHSSPMRVFGVSSLAVQLQLGKYSLQQKGNVHSLSPRRAGLYRLKSLPLVPDWFKLMQMRAPNPHSLIGSKDTIPIGQNGGALISQ